MNKLKVLYLHHSGVFGGAGKSLLELVAAFAPGMVEPHVITQRGAIETEFKERGYKVISTMGISMLDHTRFSYYRSIRWLILLREMFFLPFTIAALLKARNSWPKIDIIHANEYYYIIPIIVAKSLFRCPVVVHARSLQQNQKGFFRRRLFKWYIDNYVELVIAIDRDVHQSLIAAPKAEVVHNGINFRNENCSLDKPAGWPVGHKMVVGFVGNILPFKGTFELMQAAKICRHKGLDIAFVFVGSVLSLAGLKKLRTLVEKVFYQGSKSFNCKEFVEENELDNVYFVPFQKELSRVYSNMDVLCFPSHLEAAGRPVFEAAFLKKPSIVAITNPSEDTIIDGQTGICVKPFDYMGLADAIEELYRDEEKRSNMGQRAYQLAVSSFDITKNASKVLACYHRLLGEAAAGQ